MKNDVGVQLNRKVLFKSTDLSASERHILRKAYSISKYRRFLCGNRQNFEANLARAIAKETTGRVLRTFNNISRITYLDMDQVRMEINFKESIKSIEGYALPASLDIMYCQSDAKAEYIRVASADFCLPDESIVENERSFKLRLIVAYETLFFGKCMITENGASWIVNFV